MPSSWCCSSGEPISSYLPLSSARSVPLSLPSALREFPPVRWLSAEPPPSDCSESLSSEDCSTGFCDVPSDKFSSSATICRELLPSAPAASGSEDCNLPPSCMWFRSSLWLLSSLMSLLYSDCPCSSIMRFSLLSVLIVLLTGSNAISAMSLVAIPTALRTSCELKLEIPTKSSGE